MSNDPLKIKKRGEDGSRVISVRVRDDTLAVLDRLDPIRAACEFNISAGHLAGWIVSALSFSRDIEGETQL